MPFLILLTVLLIFILFGLFLFWRSKRRFAKKDRNLVRRHWIRIKDKASYDPKGALIEADSLIDLILKKRGYSGNLAAKLKRAAPLFSNINEVWMAHRLRNRAVHETGFSVNPQAVGRFLEAYRKAIDDLLR